MRCGNGTTMSPTHVAALLASTLLLSASAAGLLDPIIAAVSPPQYLDGEGWTASQGNISVQAVVPGDLLTDLERGGIIGDPLYELVFQGLLWDTGNWVYTKGFDASPAVQAAAAVSLVFDSVKMVADISLNGHVLGFTADQFLRYTFPVKAFLKPAGNVLTVTFTTSGDARNNDGRYMACSGGWDWAAYSLTKTGASTTTFSKGIAKSVYLLPIEQAVTIEHVVPLVYYTGAYPTAPLSDATAGPWRVSVRIFMASTGPASGSLTVTGAWGGSATAPVSIPTATTNASVAVDITVPVGGVALWWPVDVGGHPLYVVTAKVGGNCFLLLGHPLYAVTAKVGGYVRGWEGPVVWVCVLVVNAETVYRGMRVHGHAICIQYD